MCVCEAVWEAGQPARVKLVKDTFIAHICMRFDDVLVKEWKVGRGTEMWVGDAAAGRG